MNGRFEAAKISKLSVGTPQERIDSRKGAGIYLVRTFSRSPRLGLVWIFDKGIEWHSVVMLECAGVGVGREELLTTLCLWISYYVGTLSNHCLFYRAQ